MIIKSCKITWCATLDKCILKASQMDVFIVKHNLEKLTYRTLNFI